MPENTQSNAPMVTRFAPSPTGHLHIGGARTALFCWALARGQKSNNTQPAGRFMIRVEDTDQARSSDTATRAILVDLAWLGLNWDDGPTLQIDGRTIGGDDRNVGPYEQSRRLEHYNHYLNVLLEKGFAYPAFETPEELNEARKAALADKKAYKYERPDLTGDQLAQRIERMNKGEPCVIRFAVPDEDVCVHDEVLGDVRFADGQIEDFVIRKADGFPTYHFAVVVDDELMGVTHVLRGQEHLANTPKHVALQHALGFGTPTYAHLPLIMNPDGSKMSKRDKDKAVRDACKSGNVDSVPNDVSELDASTFAKWIDDKKSQLDLEVLVQLAGALKVQLPEINVEDFRASGYLPETVCNYLALLGWSPGNDIEKFDNTFLAEKFDLPRIGKTAARFDRAKLLAFNGDAITALPPEAFCARWAEWCDRYEPRITHEIDDASLSLLAQAVQPRCKTFRDAADQAAFLFFDDNAIVFDEKAVEKVLRKGEPKGMAVLAEFAVELEKLSTFDAEPIHDLIKSFSESRNMNMGKIAQPLRVAVTGTPVSPPIDLTLALLGRERTMTRINRTLDLPVATIA
ncbi:MAG: glutamate--tRNA ligase [Phycisphaeraceae bacterium]|nr:glutamate--tRNA ligase [Phycisphaerales bacterium]MCB9860023.1 glutamate--tRNA ligase [Phycisphaeraceae bacterium]